MIAEFVLPVLYTQITVAASDAAQGLLWTDDHVAQGFAWSADFVSFGMPDHDGEVRLQVLHGHDFHVASGTLWAVEVPFDVCASPTMIGTVGITYPVSVPEGRYALIFEALAGNGEKDEISYLVKLHFVSTSEPCFAIRKRGEVLGTDQVLAGSAARAPG